MRTPSARRAGAPAARSGLAAIALDARLGWLVEIAGRRRWCWSRSCVLFAGVIARYVFHRPLIWSDELASILFLWLAMLGAVRGAAPRRAHAA